MIGARLSSILTEIETTLWEFESMSGQPPEYTQEAFRSVCKIFLSAIMDKMWEVQEQDKMDEEDRMKMATQAGFDIRDLVKTYTGIDTYKFYE
jgi:hypothetical protein